MREKSVNFIVSLEYQGKVYSYLHEFSETDDQTYDTLEGLAEYLYTCGNYSCDCNRSRLIQTKCREDFPEMECGEEIKLQAIIPAPASFSLPAMPYYVDTEFIDTGRTIELISIGIIAQDGREYYAQSCELNPAVASGWIWTNVFAHLKLCQGHSEAITSIAESLALHGQGKCGTSKECPWRTRSQIREEVQTFLTPDIYGKPELIGWCAGYDWVALCQLFGTMMDIPVGWPHYIKDLQFVLDRKNIADGDLPSHEVGLHNALSDARYLKRLWEYQYSVLKNGSMREGQR